MSRLVLVTRLASRDLRHRPAQGLLLCLVIMALTAIPARVGARRPVAGILEAELG